MDRCPGRVKIIMIHSFEVVFLPMAHIPILIFGASVQFSTPVLRTIIAVRVTLARPSIDRFQK